MARPSCKLAIIANPHDFIEASLFVIDDIFAQTAPLYEKGLSLNEIADRTGFPKSSIRKELIKRGVELRPTRLSTKAQMWRVRGKTQARPPYGFCFLDGEITKDTREYPVLTLIHSRWKSGENANSITVFLNAHGIKSRLGKEWSWRAVRNIVQRFEQNKIVINGGTYELR